MKNKIRILVVVSTILLLLISHHVGAVTTPPTVAELRPSNAAIGDGFGGSVSLFNDTLVVGAAGSDLNGVDSGAVYVFIRNGSSWQQQAMLVAENGTAGDGFGASVSISGDTIVVGAPGDDDEGLDSGAAYVFVRSGTDWQQEAKLVVGYGAPGVDPGFPPGVGGFTAGTDGTVGASFGFDVAIDGDIIVVGAPFDDDKGAVYTFLRSGKIWEQQSKLLAYGTVAGDRFGCSVAIGNGVIAVGADGADNIATDDGAAFVFRAYGSGWMLYKKLSASDASEGDRFGWSVAVGLNNVLNVLVGVNRIQPESKARSGAAYVFTPDYTTYNVFWVEERLQGDIEGMDDGFGFDVAIYDNFYVVGAPRETANDIASGAVYLFSRAVTSPWPLHAKYLPQSGQNGYLFGASTAIYGDTVVTGVPGHGKGTALAYMYPCSLGRYLPASEWRMISRPCYNLSPASTLLGDDIGDGIYAKTWTVYRSDPANAIEKYNPYGYFQLEATEPLAEGMGYWIYSVTGGTLEVNGPPTPTVDSDECPSVNGCVEIPLTWPASGTRYFSNMVGNPFSHAVDWSDVVVVITPSDGSPPLAVTPSKAYELKFLRSIIYSYGTNSSNASNDITPGMKGIIMPFESIWVHTLDPQYHSFSASAIKLLIPAVGPLKTTVP